MKKFTALCLVLALTACGEKKAETPAADTTAAMKHDSAMTMSHDSTAPAMKADSTMARDTAKKM
jgi:predicted small lipoprotein YifL